MKLSIILSATMAVLVAAAPQGLDRRTDGNGDGGNSGSCNSDIHSQVCCHGLLGCVVQVLGAGCSNTVFCCETNSPIGSLININLLNCLHL